MSLAISGPTKINETVGLTPTSTGCNSTVTDTVCNLTITLAAGSYTATIDTYDASSNLLSTGQNLTFQIVAGKSNAIALSLSGVPSRLLVFPGSAISIQNPSGGIDLLGTAARNLVVQALDADGNIIFGPGAPSFNVTRTGGALGVVITAPTAYAPNVFGLQPPANYSANTETLTVTASYTPPATNACAEAGAVCTSTFTVDMRELLAVANGAGANSVTLYELPLTTPFATVTGTGIVFPQALAFDTSGDLFVGNCGSCAATSDKVEEFAAPYNGAPSETITSGISDPVALALDASGNLFVADAGSASGVTISAPPYTSASTITTGGTPYAVAIDGSDDLFVANQTSNTIQGYTPPWTGAAAVSISSGVNVPTSMGFDGNGNLYALMKGSTGSLVQYGFPITNGEAATYTITTGIDGPGSTLAMYGNDIIVPSNGSGNDVLVYQPPISNASSPSHTISNGLNVPVAVVVDGIGEVYALNTGGLDVTGYGGTFGASYNLNLTVPGLTSPAAIALLQ